MSDPLPVTPPSRTGALYRAVWRLHFYAGIIVAPFAIFLAITGAIYLWKPQYEHWRYRDLLEVAPGPATQSAAAQLAAARATLPAGSRIVSFQPAFSPAQSAQVVIKPTPDNSRFGLGTTVYVDPHTAAVLGQVDDRDRLMHIVHDLHGSLLVGKPGKYIVELAASWAFVLFLSGLYLWWPRPKFAVWGFLLPRLHAKGRIFWRDIHAVPAVWLSVATLFLLSTGLLWSQVGGKWYRTISATLGQGTPRESNAGAHRSELTGWSPPLQAGLAEKIDALASTPAAGVPTPIDLDSVITLAATHRVPTPYAIALPVGERGVYSVISDRTQAFNRTYLHLDQYSGAVLADVRFGQFGYLAQFALWGIIAHEGQLFGLANQILGTIAAAGVALLAASGLALWWQRRPQGGLAAPVAAVPLPRSVVYGTLGLAVILPMLAASLAVLVVADRLFLRRWPARTPVAT